MYERYHKAERKARAGLLNEFCVTTAYNRKYAIRLLNGPRPEKERVRRPRERKPQYGKQVISGLAGVWEAAGYPWSVRLKALLPSWMPWIRKRYRLSAKLEQQLLAMSARQMDRRLQSRKRQQKRKIYGRTQPGVLLKHHIPLKTDSWDVKAPGFTGFAFGQFGRWGVRSHPEPDGHAHGLDRIAGASGKERNCGAGSAA